MNHSLKKEHHLGQAKNSVIGEIRAKKKKIK